ncbi:MAG TPA: nickel insertion protein, partial [Candidatus Angelobacter sp.]|nr:nickel insertion protein [Candidatus Angelobacter sp.]
MRIAYLECFSGISGDMFLGALLDAGVPPELLTRTVEALGVDARLEISRVDRSGISATKLDVIAAGEKELPREEFWEKESKAGHAHEHHHGPEPVHTHSHEKHDHGHSHEHSHQHINLGAQAPSPAAEGHQHSHQHSHPHRGLKEIRQIISKAGISQSAKDRAIRIFEALGAAEAKVHNTDIETIHFHEVGAIDAIVDIVCASVGSE